MELGYMGKRRYPRTQEQHTALVNSLCAREIEGLYATATIGGGGCELESDHTIGAGTLLRVLLTIERRVIQAQARVVYEKRRSDGSFALGLEFIEMSDAHREMLHSVLALEGAEPDRVDGPAQTHASAVA